MLEFHQKMKYLVKVDGKISEKIKDYKNKNRNCFHIGTDVKSGMHAQVSKFVILMNFFVEIFSKDKVFSQS